MITWLPGCCSFLMECSKERTMQSAMEEFSLQLVKNILILVSPLKFQEKFPLFLLPAEAKHSDKVFKSEGGTDSCLQNAGLESHSPGVYTEYCGAEMSDLSCESTPRLGYKDNRSSLLLDHMSVQEQQLAYRNMFRHETPVIDNSGRSTVLHLEKLFSRLALSSLEGILAQSKDH
ncbi:hypothetical protein Pyn_14601 [Prunus yedoensis var. nudiflora]|uniref:Uncharacterized protein n=1 Tax=Prunus yedoensis var. nudiflora TaxID=2094558 RepID=A0A314ZQP4_PRUYE|nr:hypothetical protein Pyn_14601 [Prunus yedoensis var. nudiflora]